MRMEMKNRLHRYDTNRPRPRPEHRHSKYRKCLSMMMLIYPKQPRRTFVAEFLKKLTNIEAGLKKR